MATYRISKSFSWPLASYSIFFASFLLTGFFQERLGGIVARGLASDVLAQEESPGKDSLSVAPTNDDKQAPPFHTNVFRPDNLMAWCIVPFDGKKRGPVERAEMLQDLGFKKFAYDYRPEHIATFEQEIDEITRRGIEFSAWWFPPHLNEEAKSILAIIKKHRITPQLWVMGGGDENMSGDAEQQFIHSEVQRIREIADAADDAGCKVGLYNHGGWFGVPENMTRLLQAVDRSNVGIVFNLHHAHDYLHRLPQVLEMLKPHLLVLNVNGMQDNGEGLGKKILVIGQGNRDEEVFSAIAASGYSGPIGILNHTDEDANTRLQANLNGLSQLVPKLKRQSVLSNLCISAESGVPNQPVRAQDFAWLQGSWKGKGLGGDCVEVWSAPVANTMVGSFLFTQDSKPVFSEHFAIAPRNDSVTIKLKHFSPEMKGWEEKDQWTEFPFVRRDGTRFLFDGLTYIQVSSTKMHAVVRMKSKDGRTSEAHFDFVKQ